MTTGDSLSRAEELLERLESARARLERLSEQDDPDKTMEVLQELAQIARDVEVELNRAAREAQG